MYVKSALEFFGGRAGLAKALHGVRHRSAVYQWDEESLVPLAAAVILSRKSNGKLTVKDTLYEKHRQERMGILFDARQKKKVLDTVMRAPKLR